MAASAIGDHEVRMNESCGKRVVISSRSRWAPADCPHRPSASALQLRARRPRAIASVRVTVSLARPQSPYAASHKALPAEYSAAACFDPR